MCDEAVKTPSGHNKLADCPFNTKMKNLIGLVSIALLLLFSMPPIFVSAEQLSGNEIVKRADRVMIGETARYDCIMVIERPGRESTIAKYRTYFKGRGKKVLIRMLFPPKEAGKDLLMINNSMWQYIPNISRSVRVAGSQRFMGGEFNNTDLLKISLIDDYHGTLIDTQTMDGIEYYHLELKAKRPETTYYRMLYWVRKGDFMPYKEEYYALSGKMMKTLVYSDVGSVGKLTRPKKLTMINALRPAHKTTVNIVRAKFNLKLSNSFFTRTYLERKRN